MLALGGVAAWDLLHVAPAPTPPPPPTSTAPVVVPIVPPADYAQRVVEIGYTEIGQFGLRTLGGDPTTSSDDHKNLTYAGNGITNGTRVWVDGETPFFGYGPGGSFVISPRWQDDTLLASWEYEGVEVTQQVYLVEGTSTGRVDTMRIEYVLENTDSQSHQVGLRVMIDTLIGNNDGVPFLVPGQPGMVDRGTRLEGSAIPDFIQALERGDLAEPGVIVNVTLRGGDATPPDRVDLAGWRGGNVAWDVLAAAGGEGAPLVRSGVIPDSCIGLYYDPRSLSPGERRTIVAYYGLGGISSTGSGNVALSLACSREVYEGERFWVVAYVADPTGSQTVRIELPPQLALDPASAAVQSVPLPSSGSVSSVSWLVEAREPADGAQVQVTLEPDDVQESWTITILPTGITR